LEGVGFCPLGREAVLVVARAGLETATASVPASAAPGAPGPFPKATTSGCGRAVGPLVRSISAETVERAKAAAACSADAGWSAASGLNTRIQR
jgi:hypothetical protein